ncbi:MAG: hypothetical protein WCL16_13125, partial [bacterium]
WLFVNNTVITNTVATPASEANGLRWSCLGWRLTDTTLGTLITNEVSTRAVFAMTTNVTLTWLWTNQYQLAVSAGQNGSVTSNSVNGWYTNGTQVAEILATPDPDYTFLIWVGTSVPAGQATANPLAVTMNQVRTNLMAVFASRTGETKTWTGVGNWTSYTNWAPGGMPGPNDLVILQSGTATLSEAYSMGALIVSNATVIFTNWTTCLSASNVTVLSNGTMTLPTAFMTNQMSNRVWVACGNFTLNDGGRILADERGYYCAMGPGCGATAGGYLSGGGYGGQGGMGLSKYPGGQSYGSAAAPLEAGSGGGVYPDYVFGHGGGAVRIEASGEVTINGTVTANGRNGGVAGQAGGGGGSGGAIYITCASFGGNTNGILRANGGQGAFDVSHIQYSYGGGGGGRISVHYQSLLGTPGVQFSVNCGTTPYPVDINAPAERAAPQVGTLYFSDSALLDNVLTAWSGTASGLNGYFVFQSTNVWAPANLRVLNGSTLGVLDGSSLLSTNDLTVVTGGVVVAAHAILECGGALTLTNGASLVVYGGVTNGVYTNSYGTMVGVANTLTISSNCWIYPFSNSTNGGAPLLQVGGLEIQNGGGINANGRGYAWGAGPGRGTNTVSRSAGSGGGGYGGKGGIGSTSAGGASYGSTNGPLDPGSGGGVYTELIAAGHGGGVVRVMSRGLMRINGTVTANGGTGSLVWGDTPCGGGSGGAIYLTCASFDGSVNGVLQANGGNGAINTNAPTGGGGGGGGRIAVWIGLSDSARQNYLSGNWNSVIRSSDVPARYFGSVSVTNGAGYTNSSPSGATPGTVFFF